MKGAACGFALVLLASCGEKNTASADSAKSAADRAKKFVAFMEAAQEEIKALKDDVDRGRGEGAIQPRLTAIRRNISAAQNTPFPKDGVDARELAAAFKSFLERTLQELDEATWDDNSGRVLWKKLLSGCAACHQRFRDG